MGGTGAVLLSDMATRVIWLVFQLWCSSVMCKRGWRTKVDSVGDIGGNIGCELDSVTGSALFLKFFPKTSRK